MLVCALDCFICRMCDFVSPGGGLARYMECMDKLRRAVQYLTVNNPNSSQLSHVVSRTLWIFGLDV